MKIDEEYKQIITAWQARHIDKVIAFFYSNTSISPEAIVFGPIYGKLAQGLVDKDVLSLHALKEIVLQVPKEEHHHHLFRIARDCMPRSKRPPHYTEE